MMMNLIPDGLSLWGHYLEPISLSTKLRLRTLTSLATISHLVCGDHSMSFSLQWAILLSLSCPLAQGHLANKKQGCLFHSVWAN